MKIKQFFKNLFKSDSKNVIKRLDETIEYFENSLITYERYHVFHEIEKTKFVLKVLKEIKRDKSWEKYAINVNIRKKVYLVSNAHVQLKWKLIQLMENEQWDTAEILEMKCFHVLTLKKGNKNESNT